MPILTRRQTVFCGIALTLFVAAVIQGCDRGGDAAEDKRLVAEEVTAYRDDDAAVALQAIFGGAGDSTLKKGVPPVRTALMQAYRAAEYKPLWVSTDGITTAADSLVADLTSLSGDGIDPVIYDLEGLKGKRAALSAAKTLASTLDFDTSCTHAWLSAARHLLLGRLSPRAADSLWYCSNDSSWEAPERLAGDLLKNGRYPALATYRSKLPVYAMLQTALGNTAGIAADNSIMSGLDSMSRAKYSGNPDSVASLIAANLERLRWLKQSEDSQYVWVNIPSLMLKFMRATYNEFDMRVVIGRPSRQTPSITARMSNVVFNPGWGVPPTILKRDVGPGVAKIGGAYLAKKGLHAYDRHGKEIPRSAITSANFKKYSYKQPPGARNALGEVKFNFPNPWDIYLHDTPHREDFPRKKRALSSGCVRVQKPKEFAEFLLRRIDSRDSFDVAGIDSIIVTRKTRFENLKQKIPVYLVYLTAAPDSTGERVVLFSDVYNRDAKLRRLLVRASR